MFQKPRLMLLAALLASSVGAQAASFNFSGMAEDGVLAGQSFSGMFSYADNALTGSGFESLALTGLQFSFAGQSFALAAADPVPSADFQDGQFLGLSLVYAATQPQLAFVSGGTDFSQAYISYESAAGPGFGSYTISAVPEPESWALSLAGLATLGWALRRKRA
jgi:hypothetical protein